MKNAKKIGIVLLVAALIAIGVASLFIVNAAEYTGTVEKLSSLVDAVAKAKTAAEKDVALVAVEDYLKAKPVDPAEEGYDAAIASFKDAKIATVKAYLAEMEDGTNVEKIAANKGAEKWLKATFPTAEDKATDVYTELFAELHAANVATANALYSAVNTTALSKELGDNTTAVANGAYKFFASFCSSASFDTLASDYADVANKVAELTEIYEEMTEKRYQDLIAQGRLTDYDAKVAYHNDFDTVSSSPSMSNYKAVEKETGLALNNFYGRETQVLLDGSQNVYWSVRINGGVTTKGGTSHPSTYVNLSYPGTVDKFVLEFDITTFDTLPEKGIQLQAKSGCTWGYILPNGDFGDNNQNPLVPGVIAPGKWTHLTFICDMENIHASKLYIDYCYATDLDLDPGNKQYTPESLRIGNTGSSYGSFALDNINVVFGGSFFDPNYVNKMDDINKFIYLSAYMQRTGLDERFITVPDCIEAYEKATELCSFYAYKDPDSGEISYTGTVDVIKDPELKALLIKSIESYFAYDPTYIITEYKKANLGVYKQMIDELLALDKAPTSASIAARNSQLLAISNFVNANGTYIYEEVDDTIGYNYDDLKAKFAAESTRVTQDEAIMNFISAMNGFESAVSATLLQAKYDNASDLLAEGLNTEFLSDSGYEDFQRHYNITYPNAPAKIAQARSNANTKSLMASITYLLETYPTEADWKLVYIENPTTPEEIANNERYEFVEAYVSIIRGKIKGGNYNKDYVSADGVSISLSLQKFAPMDEYYYSILQLKHAEALSSQLKVFATTDSYIEKKGIIAYVQSYLESEDVDFVVRFTCENELCTALGKAFEGSVDDVAAPACPVCGEKVESYTLASPVAALDGILKTYAAYEAELEPQIDNYDELLNQNTIYFVNLVKKFDTAITFVDKIALLNEAMPYYYVMNINSDEVVEAIAKYDALQAELGVVEQSSKEFIANVILLSTAEEEDLYYMYLVDSATLRSKVDASIEGVEEALEIFDAAYDEYNNKIETANSEIKAAGSQLGTISANSGITAVLSAILRWLFSF
ncbi:MAG: hypothetical protein IKC32_02360 [Clostridia bacterium]|nr:hypothetical protein [Clostridia bacterium]